MPIVYFQAGLVPTLILFILFSIISAFVNLIVIEGMALIKSNTNFELNLEYSGLCKELFGRKTYIFFQFSYMSFTLASNIAMTRIVSQAVDNFLVLLSGYTYALQFYPELKFIKTETSNYFYKTDFILAITLGYLIISIILSLVSIFQLRGALSVQGLLMLPVIVCISEFITFFSLQGFDAQVPIAGKIWTETMGTIVFNLGLGQIIPAWINQKSPTVSHIKVISLVSTISMIFNIILPVMAVFVYGSSLTSDVFEQMTSGSTNVILRICVYIYTLTVIAFSIPINSITIKNNLYSEITDNPYITFFFGVIFQYLIGWIFESGGIFTTMLNYTSLFLGGFVGFFFPLLIYYKSHMSYIKRNGFPSSPTKIFPNKILPYWKTIILTIFLLTFVPIVMQILIDFYYLIFLHQNIV